ncbi:hypothetical protein GF318_05860 [Candidatus Micrarchaeota archaeon]|nr:hypothetical protein [Candidatus Micrarchaeota archaeon]
MEIFGLEIDRRKIAFLLIFSALAFAFYQFNFSEIIGAEPSKKFTLFQFLGPIAGGVLGPVGGVASVLLVSVSNFLLTGQALELPVIVSFFTMTMATLYFGSRHRMVAAVPLLCMVLFWLHPFGVQAWVYALFWLIPAVALFFKSNIIARSLGTTFTAHSIGSVAYLYAFNIPAGVWMGLIPVTAFERLLFAAGIAVFYYAVNTMLHAFSSRFDLSCLNIEKKYAFWKA